MALYPGAAIRLLDKPQYDLTTPDICCLHTMIGSLYGVDQYFRTVDVFSHFGIGGTWGGDASRALDGKVYQWGDTALRAAANLNGNYRVISVETADNAVRPIQPWTARQQAAIVDLLVWVHNTHGIPLVLIPDSKPGRRGIAYHRMGCDPYRVDGGELWSSSYGKDCPTQARIDQIPALIQRATAIVNGQPEDIVTPEDIVAVADEIITRLYDPKRARGLYVLGNRVEHIETMVPAAAAQDAARDAAIASAVEQLGAGTVDLDAVRAAAEQGATDALARIHLSVDPAV